VGVPNSPTPGSTGEALNSPAGPANAVITHHTGVFNGKHIFYDAAVEPVVITGAEGKPSARLVAISYVATGSLQAQARPVVFAFNGGPIVPSDALHMGALGPKRVAIPDDLRANPKSFRTVDNIYSILDVADLVFFDPAGTGFSRVLPGVDPQTYFSVNSDAQQLTQFVIEWSAIHQRVNSPKFLLGESYGTLRAAAAANQLQKLASPLSGVVLVGQALNIIEFSQRPANVTSYVVSLPTLAAIAWYHGKADTGGKDFDEFINEVTQFSRTEYLTALFQGSSLSQPTRESIALRLQRYTGLPASYYSENALKITKERYRRELFKDEKLVLGMTDARYVAPVSNGKSKDPAEGIYESFHESFRSYLQSDLKVHDAGDYLAEVPGLAEKGFDGWRWDGTGTSPFANWPYPAFLTEVFSANPPFRVFIANGWQDTQTTVGAAVLASEQSGWPRERVSLHAYQGGHMPYSVEASLKTFSEDLRRFITARP
jgi:carboxypeptidase C (cathepsin A)